MSVSIFEVLQNANYNLGNVDKVPLLLKLAKDQLHNAVTLLEKGYSLDDEVEVLLEKYGSAEEVPDKEED